MNYTDKILVIDLEATCWEDTIPENQKSEVIEIGVCLLDTLTGLITENKGILIKPENSGISEFCTKLTTITQSLLDKEGTSFKEACEQLKNEYNAHELTWASYGAFDLKMMKTQCASENIRYPLSMNHINVKTLYSRKVNFQKPFGMTSALKKLNIPLSGTHHRGIDDAKNIAKILYQCLPD